jgi:lysophospholipase
MQLIVEQVVKPNQHDPLILLAHSMGGHLALRYVHDHPGIFDKVVLTAPLLDVHLAPALKCFIHGLAQMVAGCGGGHLYAIGSGSRNALAPNRFRGNRLTSDRLRFDRNRSLLAAQPELGVNGVTYAWLKAAFDSIAILNARSYIQAITLPVLMVTAGQDTIVSRSAQLAFCDALPDCEERTISGARHEILMEADPYRAIFWETFDQFAYR